MVTKELVEKSVNPVSLGCPSSEEVRSHCCNVSPGLEHSSASQWPTHSPGPVYNTRGLACRSCFPRHLPLPDKWGGTSSNSSPQREEGQLLVFCLLKCKKMHIWMFWESVFANLHLERHKYIKREFPSLWIIRREKCSFWLGHICFSFSIVYLKGQAVKRNQCFLCTRYMLDSLFTVR